MKTKLYLLTTHFEDLAIVLLFVGQSLELRRLHVEFAGCAAHADECDSLLEAGHTAWHAIDGLAIDGHHHQPVAHVASGHIEHEFALAGCGAIGLVALHALDQDGVAGIKDIVILGGETHLGCAAPCADAVALGVGLAEQGAGGLGVDIVVVDNHRSGMFAATIARELVERCGHRANFDNLLVNLVEQQRGRCLAGEVGGQWLGDHVLASVGAINDDTGQSHGQHG